MIKYGVYRVEQSVTDKPCVTLYSRSLRVGDGVYHFYTRNGAILALYPIEHFYVINLED